MNTDDVYSDVDCFPEIPIFGDDGLYAGTASEIVAFGPQWRGLLGETLLHTACRRCEVEWVRELLNRGWSPNDSASNDGATPLQSLVAGRPYLEDLLAGDACAAALLAHGAEINRTDRKGDSVIHYGVHGRNAHAIKMLLAAGADVDHEGASQSTPLDSAVRIGVVEVVKVLIASGADVSHRNESGGTPLIWSAACSPEITKLLLEAGADPRIRDSDGETALHSANIAGCKEAASLIRAALTNLGERNDL